MHACSTVGSRPGATCGGSAQPTMTRTWRALAIMDGRPSEGIFGMNSAYPADGFWFNSQLRITPAFQAGCISWSLTPRRWLILTPAGSRAADCFSTRPTAAAATIRPGISSIAAREVRDRRPQYRPGRGSHARVGRSANIYAVNRDYYPVHVQMVLSGVPSLDAQGLWPRQANRPRPTWLSFVLGPYELRSFSIGSNSEVTGFAQRPPEPIVRNYTPRRNKRWRPSPRPERPARRTRHGRGRARCSRRAGHRQTGLVAANSPVKLHRPKVPRTQ